MCTQAVAGDGQGARGIHEGEQLANCEASFSCSQPVSRPFRATGWCSHSGASCSPPFKDSQGDLLAGGKMLCSPHRGKSKLPISRREGCTPLLLSPVSPKSDPGSKLNAYFLV